jgi:hypothetical protein
MLSQKVQEAKIEISLPIELVRPEKIPKQW